MRTIKYRGKNTVTGEWEYGYFWKDDILGDCHIREGNGTEHRVYPNTVSQLVSDDSGYEIYEGDYLQDDEGIVWLVVYDNMSHGFLTHTEGILEHSEWIDDPDVSVVGNKWDTRLEDLYENEEQDCRSCEFYGERIIINDLKCYNCLHPDMQAINAGALSEVVTDCGLYTKRHKEDKE